ncbi:MAG: ArsR/SmtB family transcription factor [Woeseiaceae bacterium]
MTDRTAQLAAQFKALADPVRMRLVAICRRGECSVSELTQVIGLSQPRISQHLKQLCEARLLERFRDGQWVFYRLPARGGDAATRRRLLGLIPDSDAVFQSDLARLQRLRGERATEASSDIGTARPGDRALHKALLELTVTAQLGDLLDIGCGRGRILKLLASRAHRAVGVDIDSDARRLARAELMLAGLPNCSLRCGDMYRLPFGDAEFDTIILDDVLVDAKQPVRVLDEAGRVLRRGGRLFILLSVGDSAPGELQRTLAAWSAAAGLRLAPARLAPKDDPLWLLSVATVSDRQSAAA